ncbi:MAG: DUF2442 domain-containing protein [Chlamydiae bacterium]|nr:DUF2442 domain-containing protein [Chlamydiota bacterium]MBI3277576.1 DUF2442 domain-containing protein [Chlamydiota bacterium]
MWNLNDVILIKYKKDYIYFVEFDDGKKGEINFQNIDRWGPIFKPLKDKNVFKTARIQGGTLSWPNGADIAPETLYERLDVSFK